MDIASSEDEYQPKEEDEDDESEEEEEDDEEDDWPVLEAGLNNSMVSNPCANGPNFNYWDRGRQASLRKLAIDVAKSGYVNKLASMLREYEPRMLLLPARQESQVGPQQTLFSAAQASGNAAVTELVEEAATDLLFKEISKLPLPDEDIEVGIVQQCLLAGANPTRPGGEAGTIVSISCVPQARRKDLGIFDPVKLGNCLAQKLLTGHLLVVDTKDRR